MKAITSLIILVALITLGLKSNADPKIDYKEISFTDSVQKKVVDPVCKMKIKPNVAKSSVYNKTTYYFCSEGCKQKFMATPSKYVSTK